VGAGSLSFTLAEEPLRKRYVGKFVGDRFTQGAQNPIADVNVDYGSTLVRN
jgi:hypothetical protein